METPKNRVRVNNPTDRVVHRGGAVWQPGDNWVKPETVFCVQRSDKAALTPAGDGFTVNPPPPRRPAQASPDLVNAQIQLTSATAKLEAAEKQVGDLTEKLAKANAEVQRLEKELAEAKAKKKS